MKLNCERSYLANALGIVGKAISGRNTLPILSYVLFEADADNDRLTLTATDLDTAIKCTIPAQVVKNGSVAIPASLLIDIVPKLPEYPISIDAEEGKASLRCGKSNYTLLTLPADDYPAVPEVSDEGSFTIKQSLLKDMLRMTTGAASKEETRSILMGVLFESRSDNLNLVATDTHRLAFRTTSLDGDIGSKNCIIPARPLIELERLLKDGDGDVEVRLSESQAQFQTNDIKLVSRLLDGSFPNYQKVIPKDTTRSLNFDRSTMIDALKRVYIVSKSNAEKVVFDITKDIATLSAESQDVGKALEEVPITLEGEDITMAFNTRFMIEALSSMKEDVVSINLTGALNPGKIKSDDNDDFLYVVMPMQV